MPTSINISMTLTELYKCGVTFLHFVNLYLIIAIL